MSCLLHLGIAITIHQHSVNHISKHFIDIRKASASADISLIL